MRAAATATLIGLAVLTGTVSGESLMNIAHREAVSLDGPWQVIVDPFNTGYYNHRYQPRSNGYFINQQPESPGDLIEYAFTPDCTLEVPGDWNTQREDLFFYEGAVWYKRDFDHDLREGRRLFVRFGAAALHARVWLNGEFLGEHTGGFTPFHFEITDLVRPERNYLVAMVDNTRRFDGIPTVNFDWWNYGGLTRPVTLVETPQTFIREYHVQLAPGARDRIEGWVQIDGPSREQAVEVRIPEVGAVRTAQTDDSGRATFSFPAEVTLWSPDDPHLHRVEIACETDEIDDEIGFRTVETRGTEILLNGEPIELRGISIHEEAPFRTGRAHSLEDYRTLLDWAQNLGCNFVRLAHYPHGEAMLREADRRGLLVWAEIPVYWTIEWGNPETLASASRQLEEMIGRDRNRASIILWSVANETPHSEPRMAFLTSLVDRARALDPTRLITAATELDWQGTTVRIADPLAEHLDVIGVNEYAGWYGDWPPERTFTWETEFDKPVIVSELGGGALAGLHGDEETRWTEEFQAAIYRDQIAMLRDIPFIRGMSPWILMDFRSPRRPLPDIQDWWNRKGLVSPQGECKAAFGVLRDFYAEWREAE